MVSIIAQMGLSQTVVRLIAESQADEGPSRTRAVIIKVVQLGCASTLVAGLCIYFGGGEWISRELFDSTAMTSVVGLTALGLENRPFSVCSVRYFVV